jgi:Flp pilus assembly pilin Flp
MTKTVCKTALKLLQAEDGGAAIEYGLLAALIAGVLLMGLSALGSTLNGNLSQLGSGMTAAQSASSSPTGGNNGNGNGYGKGGNGNGNNGAGNGNGGPNGGTAA